MTNAQAMARARQFIANTDASPAAFGRLRLVGLDRHKVACCVAYLVTLHPPVCAPAYGGR